MKDLTKKELDERLFLQDQAKSDIWIVASRYTAKTALNAQHLSTRDILNSCGINSMD